MQPRSPFIAGCTPRLAYVLLEKLRRKERSLEVRIRERSGSQSQHIASLVRVRRRIREIEADLAKDAGENRGDVLHARNLPLSPTGAHAESARMSARFELPSED